MFKLLVYLVAALLAVTAEAVPRGRGLPTGTILELHPLLERAVNQERQCGKYFAQTKKFRLDGGGFTSQTKFSWSSLSSWYAYHDDMEVVIDDTLQSPTVMLLKNEGRPRVMIHLSKKEARRARPCIPNPTGMRT